jgi:hypothetical protein
MSAFDYHWHIHRLQVLEGGASFNGRSGVVALRADWSAEK